MYIYFSLKLNLNHYWLWMYVVIKLHFLPGWVVACRLIVIFHGRSKVVCKHLLPTFWGVVKLKKSETFPKRRTFAFRVKVAIFLNCFVCSCKNSCYFEAKYFSAYVRIPFLTITKFQWGTIKCWNETFLHVIFGSTTDSKCLQAFLSSYLEALSK